MLLSSKVKYKKGDNGDQKTQFPKGVFPWKAGKVRQLHR
jgi:hypothetical protein